MGARVCNRCGGFTLLEMLIALAIFALLSVMSYSGLRSVLDQHAQTELVADRLAELQKIYLIMQRDLEQVVTRPVRDEYGDGLPALTGDEALQFTRGGWSNPLGQPRSSLQRAGYDFEDGELMRYSWRVLDRAQDTRPLKQSLTTAVERMSARFLSSAGEWHGSWPQSGQGGSPLTVGGTRQQLSELPVAVEITLDHEQFGELVWLFHLPQ